MDDKQLLIFALEIRMEIVKAIAQKGGGHIGGSLSIADLLAVLYGEILKYSADDPLWEERDYLICSKGHAGPALYAALALKGFFPSEWLQYLNVENTSLPGHCDRKKVPGIDATTGSLGQGLSIACGVAMGLRAQRRDSQYVYCITGDGESAEGQIWEAAAFAAHYKLDHLIAFLDWNKKQIDGTNDEVMALGDVLEKYKAFGWNAVVIDGGDIKSIHTAILDAKKIKNGKPTMLVLDTIKGAGVPVFENLSNNHCIGVPQTMAEEAICYLAAQYKAIKGAE